MDYIETLWIQIYRGRKYLEREVNQARKEEKAMAAALGDLLAVINTLIKENPGIENAPVYDGEGHPFMSEAEIDSGDVLIYFEQ